MVGPEEGWRGEGLGRAQHVVRGKLSLALGMHPMLDARRATCMRVAGDVACRKDAGSGGTQALVNDNAVIYGKPDILS